MLSAGTRAAWSEALFAEPGQFQHLRALPPKPPWLLHLGDSMLYGAGIRSIEAVPARLGESLPAFSSINGGIPGSTIDLQFVFLSRLLRAWPTPAAVILHVFPANDLEEIDRPVDACGGQPVLAPGSVKTSCTAPHGETPGQRLRHTPLPLPVVRAAQWSWLARRLVIARDVLLWHDGPKDIAALGRRYAQIAQSLNRLLQDQGIQLLVVVMPSRSGPFVDTGVAARTLATVFRDMQIPVLEAQSVFAERVRAGQEAQLFLSGTDPHFSPEGAAVYAAFVTPWLERELRRR